MNHLFKRFNKANTFRIKIIFATATYYYLFIHSFAIILHFMFCEGVKKIIILFISIFFLQKNLQAQSGLPDRLNNYTNRNGTPINTSDNDSSGDKLQHRDKYEDSITISYRYWDSTTSNKIDSSISNYYTRFPVPNNYIDLGNFGNAARNLIFSPLLKSGWDAGFHAYDIYRYTPENTQFYQTTRPYSELAYLLGSRTEQMLQFQHTQNRSSNFNLNFNFRIINSPGAFKNQNTNHTNLRINTWFQSDNKRYTNYFIFINNKIRSAENGGVQDDNKLNNLSLNDPFEADTRLGTNAVFYRSVFSTDINVGTSYDESILLFRQQYDLGQKDSLVVNDSVTYKLFYPRIRFQHTISYTKNRYQYQDLFPVVNDYREYYNLILLKDTVVFKDEWKNLSNDFSIISYPQKNNLNQFLKLNVGHEYIKGTFAYADTSFSNVYAGAEYRNRTRNQLWDVELSGKFYMVGQYAGDYSAYATLARSLKNNKGSLLIGFQNVNRTPSFVADNTSSSFPSIVSQGIGNNSSGFNKENIAKAFTSIEIPQLNFKLTADYFLITNYVYFDGYYQSKQYSTLFNVLHVGAQKKFSIAKHWNLYSQVHLQQTTGNPPLNLPLIFTLNRIAFEGNFFHNLDLSTGLEFRYYSAYKADNYSPLTGQFFFQDVQTINNRPDVNLFLNFRIKSFKGFIRFEGLNALNEQDKFSFTKYNYTAPHYATRGIWFRYGLWWNFVN